MTTVAFLGLGTMGAGMVTNLLEAGFSVVGFNRTSERARPLVDRGMKQADTPAAAAREADFLVTCVSNDAALDTLAFGADGFIDALPAGALVLDCSTTSRDLTLRLHRALRQRDVAFVDAPITGSKLGAEGGKLTFMVGGATSDVERARPLFDAMGKYTVHVSETIGQGQAAKWCLNMTQAVMLEGILEGLTLAKTLGVEPETMMEIFENSAGRSGVGAFKAPYLFSGDYTPHFRLDLMHKDLHLALGEAAAARVPLPAARSVLTVYDQAVAEGLGPEDFLAGAKLLERWAGVSLSQGDEES